MQTYPMERWMHGLCVKDVGLQRLAFEIAETYALKHPFNRNTASQSCEAKPRRMDNLKRFQDLLNRIPLGTNLSRARDGNYSGKDERPGRKAGKERSCSKEMQI